MAYCNTLRRCFGGHQHKVHGESAMQRRIEELSRQLCDVTKEKEQLQTRCHQLQDELDELRFEKQQCGAVVTEAVALQINLISGSKLTSVRANPASTGFQLKVAAAPFVQSGARIVQLVDSEGVFSDGETVASRGLCSGAQLQAVIRLCDYVVVGAGVAVVNGCYMRSNDEEERIPQYTNENGVLLFRFEFPNGRHYWYFSDQKNLRKSHGDYYRVKSEDLLPPIVGWVSDRCPLGRAPVPAISDMRMGH